MKIFVAGGTGLIGSLLVKDLLSKNHEISILSRNKKKVEKQWEGKVKAIEGNVTQSGSWQVELNGQDAVINLVGENIMKKRWTKKRKQVLYDSRIESTKNLVTAVQKATEKPTIFISVSGADYYPTDMDKVFNEEDDPGTSFLSKVCADWEAPLSGLEGVRITIFRFAVAFSHSGKTAELMFIPHKLFAGGWVGSGKQPLMVIHMEDMVGSILWALENDVEGIFNSACPEMLRFKEVAKIGGKILHRWTWTWMPGIILKVVLGKRADTLLKGRFISTEKIQQAGYAYKYKTVKDILEDVL